MSYRRLLFLGLVAPALASLSAPDAAYAQAFNLLELRSEYLPPTALDGQRPLGGSPWSTADDVQVSTYSIAVNLPLALGDSTLLLPGAAYRLDSLSFSHESPAELELALHAVEVPITLIQLLSTEWMLLFQVSPGIAGDFEDLDDGALRMGGIAVASYELSERLALGLGGAATYEFGSFLPVPVVYLQWEPVERVSVDALLPVVIDAKLELGDRVELGLHGDVEGNSYALTDRRTRNAWPCAADLDDQETPSDEASPDRELCIDHVAYSVATAGATVGVRLIETLWLSLYVGHTFFRRFEEMNDDNEHVRGGRQTLPDVFFARAGLTWRLPEARGDGSRPASQPTAEPRGQTP